MGRSCDLKCDKASARTQMRLENMAILGGPNRIDANYPRQQQSPPMSNVPIASNGTGSIRMRDSFTYAICHSELPSLRGLHYECRYIDSSRSQVDQCRFCEYGVISGTHGPICMTKMEDWLKDFSDVTILI